MTILTAQVKPKGQITLPPEIRRALGVSEGDTLSFNLRADGTVVLESVKVVPADQAYFWSDRWQKMEREAEADLAAGNFETYPDGKSAAAALRQRRAHAKK
jgi:AbrB family looped-hinge helix DNA binding protein